MPEMYAARASGPRRSVSSCAVALALVLAAACNDNDALRGVVSGGGAGASAGGVANSGAAGDAGGASLAGTGGSAAGESGAGASSADAGAGDASDAGAGGESDGGAGGAPGQAMNCESGGALFLAGNYVDPAGNRFLLRSAAKAATLAIVPAGSASPAKLPQLYEVDRLCAAGGALIAKDASASYRVDFVQTGLKFAVCISAPVATLAAALALPPAVVSHLVDSGCAGKPFSVYTAEAL